MTTSELKNITSEFNDIRSLIETKNKLLKQTNKVRRKLKTHFNKYIFLKDLVDIGSCGDRLVNAIVDYFKALGYERIENVDKKYKDEDVRLWIDDKLFLFEITGINTHNPKDDKVHQISKHIPSRQKEFKELRVIGVFIVNHDYEIHFTKRNKKPFRGNLDKIAKGHNYTMMTTVDLFNAFIDIKKGNLTKEELIKILCLTGEVKILGS